MLLVRKQLPILDMLRSIKKYILLSLFMSTIVVLIGNCIEIAILANIVQVIVGIVLYVIMMKLLKDEIQTEILNKIYFFIKRDRCKV